MYKAIKIQGIFIAIYFVQHLPVFGLRILNTFHCDTNTVTLLIRNVLPTLLAKTYLCVANLFSNMTVLSLFSTGKYKFPEKSLALQYI